MIFNKEKYKNIINVLDYIYYIKMLLIITINVISLVIINIYTINLNIILTILIAFIIGISIAYLIYLKDIIKIEKMKWEIDIYEKMTDYNEYYVNFEKNSKK